MREVAGSMCVDLNADPTAAFSVCDGYLAFWNRSWLIASPLGSATLIRLES
jgi:hypothetical protein